MTPTAAHGDGFVSNREQPELDDRLLDELAARLAPRLAALLTDSPGSPGRVAESGGVNLLAAEDAGALLGVPASWVLAEARADRVPHVRLGRYVRFHRNELEAWWRARCRGPRSSGAGERPARNGSGAA